MRRLVTRLKDKIPVLHVAETSAQEASQRILEQLRLKDEAEIGNEALIGFLFVERFGDPGSLRDTILAHLGSDFSLEDVASRFVSVKLLDGLYAYTKAG